MHKYTHTYTYIYVYMCICTNIHIYTYTYIYIYTYTNTYRHIHMCIYTCVGSCARRGSFLSISWQALRLPFHIACTKAVFLVFFFKVCSLFLFLCIGRSLYFLSISWNALKIPLHEGCIFFLNFPCISRSLFLLTYVLLYLSATICNLG